MSTFDVADLLVCAAASMDAALLQFGYDLSGHKVYTKVNGSYAQGLNLEGKLVVQ